MNTSGVVLGVGAPNRCRDGSATMCAIVITRKLGLIRIYPLKVEHGVTTWSVCDLELTPSSTDNRSESWRIVSCNVTGKIESRDEKSGLLQSCILKTGAEDPVDYQNASRASIAVVKPGVLYPYVTWGKLEQAPEDYCSEDAWISCQCEMAHKPYVHWTTPNGKPHHSHVVAREAYEWLRKYPERPHALFDNMQFINPDYIHWFVIGNMKNRRNVWVIVHVHRLKLPVNDFMPYFLEGNDGKGSSWPYLKQEAENAKRAESPQLDLPFIINDTAPLTRGSMILTR